MIYKDNDGEIRTDIVWKCNCREKLNTHYKSVDGCPFCGCTINNGTDCKVSSVLEMIADIDPQPQNKQFLRELSNSLDNYIITKGQMSVKQTLEEKDEAKEILRELFEEHRYYFDPYCGFEDREWCNICGVKWMCGEERPPHKDDCLWKRILDCLDEKDPFYTE